MTETLDTRRAVDDLLCSAFDLVNALERRRAAGQSVLGTALAIHHIVTTTLEVLETARAACPDDTEIQYAVAYVTPLRDEALQGVVNEMRAETRRAQHATKH